MIRVVPQYVVSAAAYDDTGASLGQGFDDGGLGQKVLSFKGDQPVTSLGFWESVGVGESAKRKAIHSPLP